MNLQGVVDTDVYLSAILFGGAPATLLLRANGGEFSILTSEHILHEVGSKLITKFKRDPAIVRGEIQQLRLLARLVTPAERIHACRDEDDDRILECAVAGEAHAIVIGDRDLLVIEFFAAFPSLRHVNSSTVSPPPPTH